MTVSELIEHLETHVENGDGNKDVRLAMQPNWPFEYSICEQSTWSAQATEEAVYLAEGTQLGYLPGDVGEELGW